MKWPGAIGYVPQNVVITDGTVRSNIELGFEPTDLNLENVLEAIHGAHLDELVAGFRLGIEESVGERGSKLSGGERQRLGLARALYTNPAVLILDEATSSLDASTEEAISKAISAMRTETTIVVIAHRLSTVLSADLVVYLENGSVRASGSFAKVRSEVPEFDKNARLLGI
jgi:ABC-type multidrug transport system fused ATPase/permease subunit